MNGHAIPAAQPRFAVRGTPVPAVRPTKPGPSRMALSNVRVGRNVRRKRIVLYGVEGVGKSSFAASAPNPIFLCPEKGSEELDVPRFPEPTEWAHVFEALEALKDPDHPYDSLVIDTVDWLEPLVVAHVCKTAGKRSLSAFDYGDGYHAMLDEWRRFVARLEEVRSAKDMWIVLLAHSHVKPFKDPANETYDRYTMKLYEKSAGLIREWADAVLFANYDVTTMKEKSGRIRAHDSGPRLLLTQRSAAYDAKNRLDLPGALPLSWEAFEEAAAAHLPENPDRVIARLEALLPRLSAEHQAKVTAAMGRVGRDAVKLAHLFNLARAHVELEGDDDVSTSTTAPTTEKEDA